MGVSPRPVLMTVAVAAAAAFLTPVATPTNLMVMEPGGYRFGDYWKLGMVMMVWFFVVAILLNRYGDLIRSELEKRLGLWVAIGAVVLVLGFVIAFKLV